MVHKEAKKEAECFGKQISQNNLRILGINDSLDGCSLKQLELEKQPPLDCEKTCQMPVARRQNLKKSDLLYTNYKVMLLNAASKAGSLIDKGYRIALFRLLNANIAVYNGISRV